MQQRGSALALTPLLFFLVLFFGFGLYYTFQGDPMGFYHLRAPIAILPAIALALWLGRKRGKAPLDSLLKGMGEPSIMLMCLIFLLAGAFAQVTRQIGGVDATVYLGITALPHELLLPGIFVIASLIALAMGTSMGTIAAVAPIAIGFAEAAHLDQALTLGAVVGGAMFGDNLSIISDTTIAATRTQGAQMQDKFKANLWIALPAAALTALILFMQPGSGEPVLMQEAPVLLVLPYLLVLILAVAGMNVLLVLTIGLISAGVLGALVLSDYSLTRYLDDMWQGFLSMIEITLLSILVGGLANLMREQGGLSWLLRQIRSLSRNRQDPRTGEIGIASLSALSNLFIANNTVSILISGSVAKELAQTHQVSPARSASLLDIFACVVQGLLPYGAQILLAASLAGIPPLLVAGKVFYCWVLAGAAFLAIALGKPKS